MQQVCTCLTKFFGTIRNGQNIQLKVLEKVDKLYTKEPEMFLIYHKLFTPFEIYASVLYHSSFLGNF